jgi:hypothetical protein
MAVRISSAPGPISRRPLALPGCDGFCAARTDGFIIVAECTDGDEVSDAVAEHHPPV